MRRFRFRLSTLLVLIVLVAGVMASRPFVYEQRTLWIWPRHRPPSRARIEIEVLLGDGRILRNDLHFHRDGAFGQLHRLEVTRWLNPRVLWPGLALAGWDYCDGAWSPDGLSVTFAVRKRSTP